jgi:phage/plasmid-associated DNA primase
MTGRTSEECLFYLYGPTRAGKGTFTETIMALLGQPVGKEVNFTTFTSKRDGDTQNFDLAPLKPARYVTASEDNKYDVLRRQDQACDGRQRSVLRFQVPRPLLLSPHVQAVVGQQ